MKTETSLFCVAILHSANNFESTIPIIHNVTREIAKAITRHYNKIFERKNDPWDDTTCIMLSQDYCTNWRDFI